MNAHLTVLCGLTVNYLHLFNGLDIYPGIPIVWKTRKFSPLNI